MAPLSVQLKWLGKIFSCWVRNLLRSGTQEPNAGVHWRMGRICWLQMYPIIMCHLGTMEMGCW